MANEGWTEWSKHVLKELERLNANHETIRDKIEEIQSNLAEVKSSGIDELRAWKKEVTEVASPSQLKELQKKVEDLERFKIKAMTAFVLIQSMVTIVLAILAL